MEEEKTRSDKHVHYATVTEAIDELRKKGFTADFNLKDNLLVCLEAKLHPEDFELKEVYTYEGMTDPGDEASVYGIESKDGLKGILVIGDASAQDGLTTEMLTKLTWKR